MTAQGMLNAIIQALDEKINAVVVRLDNLEERIPFSGGWSAEYEEKMDAAIDVKLFPVLERLDRVEEQLRELSGEAPEAAAFNTPDSLPVSGSLDYEEPEEPESGVVLDLDGEPWDAAEYWDYVLDLEELAERLDRLDADLDSRLEVYADAVGVSVHTENP